MSLGPGSKSNSHTASLSCSPSLCTWFISHPTSSWDRPRCAAPKHRALLGPTHRPVQWHLRCKTGSDSHPAQPREQEFVLNTGQEAVGRRLAGHFPFPF